MNDPNEVIEDFDAEQFVGDYQAAVARHDAATTPEEREECRALIESLKRRWEAWQGDDSLHEHAFGG